MMWYDYQNTMKRRIEIIKTGGTFDKIYDPVDELTFPDESHVPTILDRALIERDDIHHLPLMSIDSKHMDESHRADILRAVHRSYVDKIVVTHGTDSMAETARHLQSRALTHQAVVLTGAMRPYAYGMESDAVPNLIHALAVVEIAKRGVYVAMHGEIFLPETLRKDKGRFVGRTVSLEELAAGPK